MKVEQSLRLMRWVFAAYAFLWGGYLIVLLATAVDGASRITDAVNIAVFGLLTFRLAEGWADVRALSRAVESELTERGVHGR